MKRLLPVMMMAALLMNGCGTVYRANRAEMIANSTEADYGPKPPDNHAEMEEAFVRTVLKDPYSAIIESTDDLRPNVVPASADAMSTEAVRVWQTKMRVNAKNSYGAYVGMRDYFFAWKDGKMFAYLVVSDYSAPVMWTHL